VPVKIHVPPGYDPSAVMLYRVTTPPDKRRHSRQGVGVRWKRGHEVVELPEGEQTLYANFDSLRPGSVRDVQSEERTIVVKGGETAAPVEFRFAARTAIHVDVKSESGEGAFQAVVYCMENPRGREPDLTLLKSLGKSTTMGHDFRFLELKPGTYLLGVAAGWSAPIESTRFVDLTEGELERVEFSLRAAPASGDAFLLRVRSAGSMPLAHPRLSLEIEGSAPAPLELTAERDGYAFKLSEDRRELLRRRDPAPPAATLTIEAAYHATVKIPFDVRKRELDVELPKAVTLTIRLSGYRGSGREGLLSILVKQQGSNGSGVHRVDADGTAVVPYLTPGTYELRVSMATPNPADPYASEILTAQQIEVPAEGGEVTLTLAGSAGAK
jgi:hypothetical protein